jgi:hypothetical protein
MVVDVQQRAVVCQRPARGGVQVARNRMIRRPGWQRALISRADNPSARRVGAGRKGAAGGGRLVRCVSWGQHLFEQRLCRLARAEAAPRRRSAGIRLPRQVGIESAWSARPRLAMALLGRHVRRFFWSTGDGSARLHAIGRFISRRSFSGAYGARPMKDKGQRRQQGYGGDGVTRVLLKAIGDEDDVRG